jgi:hypothetical protein
MSKSGSKNNIYYAPSTLQIKRLTHKNNYSQFIIHENQLRSTQKSGFFRVPVTSQSAQERGFVNTR